MKKKSRILFFICLLMTHLSASTLKLILSDKTNYDFSSLENPFANSDSNEQRFKLQAIFFDRVKIDNRWYKKGDTFKEYQILDITNNHVVLKHYSGVESLLKFKKESRVNVE